MRNPRHRSKLLPQKLALIREHSELTHHAMKERLQLSTPARVLEYENGKREPPMEIVLGYGRLGGVPMESIVDDEISLKEFRSQLGTFSAEKTADKPAGAGRRKRVPRTR